MFLFSFLLTLGLVVLGQEIPPWVEHYYTQTLNHFDTQQTTTFQQRYLTYEDKWDKKGPILFYAGNEGNIESFWNNTGLVFELAEQWNGLVIFGEHRYYGKTLPFGDKSFQYDNIQYLTMELAIADYAVLVTYLKTAYNAQDLPVVTFGGSYGGILATLCRIHYPAIFDMSLAGSAPVLQTLNLINGTVFFNLVTNDYAEATTPNCPEMVRDGFTELIQEAKNKNFDKITEKFSLCSTITSDMIEYLELWARNGLLTMAMADYPYSASFLGSLPPWPVNASCELIKEYYDKEGPMAGLAAGTGLFYNGSNDNTLTCFNITEEFIECADQTGCGLGNDATAWDYQMCTEIVYSMITNNVTDMFPPRVWDFDSLKSYCNETYGVTPNPSWMQIYFPADVADATSRVIFSNGLLDPWHGGGYLQSLGPDLPAVIIPSGAHHLDLRGTNPKDPPDVTQARKTEINYLENWLSSLSRQRHVETDLKRIPKKILPW